MAVLEEQLKKAYRTVTEGKFRSVGAFALAMRGLTEPGSRFATVNFATVERSACIVARGKCRCAAQVKVR